LDSGVGLEGLWNYTSPAAGAGALGATSASSLAKFLKDNLGIDVNPSTLGLLGTALSTGLGIYGSNQQTNALEGIAQQQRNDRLPALNAFNNALQNPNSFYESAPAMGATDAVLRKLSANVGNPFGNPGAIAQAAAYNLGGYNDYLRSLTGPAFGGQAADLQAQTQAAASQGNVYSAVGSGLSSLLSNKPDLGSLFAQYLAKRI
jgi:hypothetical protein